jgi:hypothetical protein
MTADVNLRRLTLVLDALQNWLQIISRMSKIVNNKPFLEAKFKKTRFSNATLGGSTIYQGKGL